MTETDDEAEFIEAYDHREEDRILSDILLTFERHGLGYDDNPRVTVLIERDRRDRIDDQLRDIATIEVDSGIYINLADIVVPPTPEWLSKGDYETYTPRQPDKTVRSVRTVRRVLTPIIARLWKAGKIDDDMARACLWYRITHEMAGIEGRWSTSRWRGPDDIPAPSGVNMQAGHMPMTTAEADARLALRKAQKRIPTSQLKFFEKIVIDDIPLSRAARFARCRNERALPLFRNSAECVALFCERAGIDLPPLTDLVRG